MDDHENTMLSERSQVRKTTYDSIYRKSPEYANLRASLVAQLVKNLPTMWETWV